MQQLTIRGLDADLARVIRETAEEHGISPDSAVLHLLRKGAGLGDEPSGRKIGHRLDHLFGGWSEQEARAFHEATQDLDEVDPEMWQ